MANQEEIYQELVKLSIAYPAAKRGADEIQILQEMWIEDLEDVSDQEFKEAIKIIRKQNEFFPTSAQVRKIVFDQRQQSSLYSNDQELPQRPSFISEEERQKNLENAKKLKEQLAKNMRLQ